MKNNLKKMISLCLVLVLALAAVPCARATGDADVVYQVSGYEMKRNSAKITSVRKGNGAVDITVYLTRTKGSEGIISVSREVDSFTGGKAEAVSDGDVSDPVTNTQHFTITGLSYTGVGQDLKFTVFYSDGTTQNFVLTVRECYTDDQIKADTPVYDDYDDPPEPKPAPRAIITYSGLPELLASGETATVSVSVKNSGNSIMKAPILEFTVSESLLIADAKYTVALSDIKAGNTVSVNVPVKAFGKITVQKQSVDVAMSFDYYNNVSTVSSEAAAHIIVPCKLSEEKEEEEPTTGSKPVPIIILSGYSYGGASIAAGSEADLHFTFTNTSKSLAVENVVLKVTTGANLQLNGSSNTFYFESVPAGGSKSVVLPLKAVPMISGSTQDVGLSFSYEYVDDEQRRERTSEMSISVPLYQPDRLELSEPVAAYVGFVGEETSLTMDYVNKGKTEVSNVEATISGDVDSYNSFVRVGNIPSGKSGTIAFAVTPMLEGDNKAVITVSYEDANGDVKERTFETTLSAMAMEPFDPGEWEEPPYPVEEQSHFPWWIVAVALAVVTIIVGIVMSKKKKKAKLAKEQELWDDWDDDDGAAKAVGTEEAKPLPETAGAVTEEATK